jgi:hypothetical protein
MGGTHDQHNRRAQLSGSRSSSIVAHSRTALLARGFSVQYDWSSHTGDGTHQTPHSIDSLSAHLLWLYTYIRIILRPSFASRRVVAVARWALAVAFHPFLLLFFRTGFSIHDSGDQIQIPELKLEYSIL